MHMYVYVYTELSLYHGTEMLARDAQNDVVNDQNED
jgi:hypothetical protein